MYLEVDAAFGITAAAIASGHSRSSCSSRGGHTVAHGIHHTVQKEVSILKGNLPKVLVDIVKPCQNLFPYLGPPDAWPLQVRYPDELIHVHVALELELPEEGAEGAEGGSLGAAEAVDHQERARGRRGAVGRLDLAAERLHHLEWHQTITRYCKK